jgi:hypothetical protein
MFKEISTKIIYLDPLLAEEMLNLNTFECQRRINEKHVRKLGIEIENGTFRVGEIATAVKRYNGNAKVLINGQHQCHAVLNTGKEIKVVFENYDVFDPLDLSLLFRKFDNHFQRTIGQKSIVEARALGISWTNRIVSLVTAAICYKNNFKTADMTIDALRHYLKVGDFVNNLFHQSENLPRHLMRGPVVHAIMLTWEKSQSDSDKFWKQVRDGENLKKSDPTFMLRDYLLSTSVGYGSGAKDARKASSHEMTSKSIAAWNAFRRNGKTDLKYYSVKPIPKAV